MNPAALDILRRTNEQITDRICVLEGQLDELREELEAARDACRALEKQANSALDLASAVRNYLSLIESPPSGMDPALVAEMRFRFRRDVEDALRNAPT
jgi:hypothetical protein